MGWLLVLFALQLLLLSGQGNSVLSGKKTVVSYWMPSSRSAVEVPFLCHWHFCSLFMRVQKLVEFFKWWKFRFYLAANGRIIMQILYYRVSTSSLKELGTVLQSWAEVELFYRWPFVVRKIIDEIMVTECSYFSPLNWLQCRWYVYWEMLIIFDYPPVCAFHPGNWIRNQQLNQKSRLIFKSGVPYGKPF